MLQIRWAWSRCLKIAFSNSNKTKSHKSFEKYFSKLLKNFKNSTCWLKIILLKTPLKEWKVKPQSRRDYLKGKKKHQQIRDRSCIHNIWRSCIHNIWKDLVFIIYEELLPINNKNTDSTVEKMGKHLKLLRKIGTSQLPI